MNIRTNVQETHYPVGHVREGFEEIWGWAETVKYSKRSDPAIRYLRAKYVDEFPEPLAVLINGAIYLAAEMRTFLDAHPKRHSLTEETIEEIRGLYEGGATKTRIAELLDIHPNTVTRYTR